MFENMNKKIRAINPWIRFLCVVLLVAVVGVATYLITANLVPPLTAQSTLSMDDSYLPVMDKHNGLAGAYASQSVTASKDERVLRLLLKVGAGIEDEAALNARYEELRPLIAQVNYLDAMEAELDALIANSQRKPQVEAEILQKNEALMGLYDEYAVLADAEGALQGEVSAKEAALADAQEKIDSFLTAEELAAAQAELAAAEAELTDLQAALDASTEEIAALKAEQTALNEKLTGAKDAGNAEEIAAVEAEIDALKSTLTEKNTAARAQKMSVQEKQKEIKALTAKSSVQLTEEELAAAKAEVETLKAEVETLKASLAPKTEASNKMLDTINAANDEITALTNELTAMEPKQLQAVGEVPADVAAMEGYIADMKAKIAEVRMIEEMRGHLTTANADNVAEQAIDGRQWAMKGVNTLYVRAQADNAEQAMEIADLYTTVMNEQIIARVQKTAQDDLTTAQKALTNEETKQKNLQRNLDKLNEQLADKEAAGVQADIDAHKAKIADAEKQVAASAEAIAAAEKNIADKQARLDTLHPETLTATTAAQKVPSTDGRVMVATVVAMAIAALLGFVVLSGQPLFDSANTVFFVVFTIICVFPFYYLFINTISENDLVTSGRINFFPQGVHLQNYIDVFKVSDIPRALLVTTARTIIGTALMVLVSAWAGYLVTKQKMWRRSLLYRILVMTMYFNAGLIPWYMNMFMLGLTDTFLAYILPGLVAPYNIILVKTYIESIPASLEESAVIDGANTPTVFMKIILPLSVPILATIAIFGAVGNWNSFQDSLLLMSPDRGMETLQHRLYIHLNSTSAAGAQAASGSGGVSEQMAENLMEAQVLKYTISMVTVIPILLVYPFMQRFFVKGIMLGAVKG